MNKTSESDNELNGYYRIMELSSEISDYAIYASPHVYGHGTSEDYILDLSKALLSFIADKMPHRVKEVVGLK